MERKVGRGREALGMERGINKAGTKVDTADSEFCEGRRNTFASEGNI